jgi:hypothetical protein
VAGKDTGGGTIVAKNRDAKPDHQQILKFHRPPGGYASFGLYAVGGELPGLKNGVNEKGLAVLTATASCLPQSARDDQPGQHPIMGALLARYASCDEVLAAQNTLFPLCRAGFLLIADRKKILVVETGLRGRFAIKTVENGRATHTNHYLEEALAEFNVKASSGSTTRLKRITDLLASQTGLYDTAAFAAMSNDQHDGPDKSLWRTGKSLRTLSSWILESPAAGPQRLRVVLANSGGDRTTNAYVLDEKFWR